jgi:hypothetical protein
MRPIKLHDDSVFSGSAPFFPVLMRSLACAIILLALYTTQHSQHSNDARSAYLLKDDYAASAGFCVMNSFLLVLTVRVNEPRGQPPHSIDKN